LLFTAVNDELTNGLLMLAERWQPDLVLHEPLAVAAAKLGVPTVLHENSLFDGPTLLRVTGGDKFPAPLATISIAPPSVLPDRPGWPMRAGGYSGGGDLPEWLARPGARARIAVSRSTVAAPGAGRLMSRVIEAAGGVDAEFVLIRPDARAAARLRSPKHAALRYPDERAATGTPPDERAATGSSRDKRSTTSSSRDKRSTTSSSRDKRAATGTPPDERGAAQALPAHVRTVDWAPVPEVLAHCTAIVHHGGAGTTLAALAAGVPQLIINGPGDRRHNAALIEARGAGIAADEPHLDATMLTRLITDADLAKQAQAVRDEMAAMPTPEEVVARIEGLRR
jgi:UDP:flavonoid glycosyltransferase YjiC (YdhE family)